MSQGQFFQFTPRGEILPWGQQGEVGPKGIVDPRGEVGLWGWSWPLRVSYGWWANQGSFGFSFIFTSLFHWATEVYQPRNVRLLPSKNKMMQIAVQDQFPCQAAFLCRVYSEHKYAKWKSE
jgi:hypothetical protein